jgi:hypothetical protein
MHFLKKGKDPKWTIYFCVRKKSIGNKKMLESDLKKANLDLTDDDEDGFYRIIPLNGPNGPKTIHVEINNNMNTTVETDLDAKDLKKLSLKEYPKELLNNIGEAIIESASKALEDPQIKTAAKIVYKYWKGKDSHTNVVVTARPDTNKETIKQILNAISTKPFLILAGVSGTGKTQIARLVAGVMSKEL